MSQWACAWCNPPAEGQAPTSHGICPRHYQEVLAEHDALLREVQKAKRAAHKAEHDAFWESTFERTARMARERRAARGERKT